MQLWRFSLPLFPAIIKMPPIIPAASIEIHSTHSTTDGSTHAPSTRNIMPSPYPILSLEINAANISITPAVIPASHHTGLLYTNPFIISPRSPTAAAGIIFILLCIMSTTLSYKSKMNTAIFTGIFYFSPP